VYYEEQKSVQLEVSRFIIITHAEFIKTLSIAQAIGHKSQNLQSIEKLKS